MPLLAVELLAGISLGSMKRRLIGYWASPQEPEWPDPVRFVDLDWDDRVRQQVVAYLRGGQGTPWACAGPSFCRICQEVNGSGQYMDDAFIWPERLAHYVERHSVRLPDEFVAHVVERGEPEYWESRVDGTWWKAQQHGE